MTLFRIAIFSSFFLHDVCMAHTFQCTSEQCQNTIINCLPHEDCMVSCADTESCLGSVINCPLNGNCTVFCLGDQSCQDTIIDATSSNGHFNLLCDESTDQCKGIKIYGSTLDTNTGTFTVTCNGNLRACVHSEIHCHRAGNCKISCNGDTSCRWSQITGPSMNGRLNVDCDGKRACFDAILDGRLSSSLDIGGCSAFESCSDVTLYCPPNTNGYKRCFMPDHSGSTTIYAIHGFDDIDIDDSSRGTSHHDAKMFCGDHYDTSCDIATHTWTCAQEYDDDNEDTDDDNENCDAKNEQNTPTDLPTVSPSHIQTISSSSNPTLIPTPSPSASPSLHNTNAHLSNMSFEDDSTSSKILSWTWELQIGFGLFVVSMCLFLGIYCCRERNGFKSNTNQQTVGAANQKPKTFASKTEVQHIPMHDDDIPNAEGVRDPYQVELPHCFPDPTHVMYDAISIQTEQTIRRPSMSKESNMTNVSAMANASVADIKERNTLLSNQLHRRYCMDVTVHRNGEHGRRYDSSTSSEAEMSSETSVDASTEETTDDEDDLFYKNE
eukprot:20590_1